MPVPPRRRRICALLSSVLAVLAVLAPLADAGATIEDIPGVYRGIPSNIGCPKTVTVFPALGFFASIVTAEGKCRRGNAVLREGPRANMSASVGDAITKLLVERGEALVGTIVLGNTTRPVRCPPGPRSEVIRRRTIMNFIRPRTVIKITLDNRTTKFDKGQYYLILRETCIYRRDSSRTPPAPPKEPTITGVPNSQGRNATSAPTGDTVPANSVNMWVWAGPVIGVAVVALCSIVAFVAVRRVRAQWYPFSAQNQSEASLGGFFDSLSSSPPPPAELDESVPRMRYSTDVDFHGEQPAYTPVVLPPPPRDEFESSSEEERSEEERNEDQRSDE